MGLLHDVTSIITHFVRLVMEKRDFSTLAHGRVSLFCCF